MNASENCITLIKKLEGFVSKPYYDYNQWSVGYGTRCPEEDRVRYQTYGITTAEADALLRKYVDGFAEDLNEFIDDNNLSLKQCQFDALLSFTYNLGSDWMNNQSTFRTSVLKGSTGNDFIFAIARWCTANNEILDSLIKRRLIEANLYLNGTYSTAVPSNYKYVIFDNVLENAVNDVRIQAYDSTKTSSIRATASKSGFHFLGWYTAEEGGALVTSVGPKTTLKTLYAHWQDGDGKLDADGNVIGTAAQYQHTITDAAGQLVREKPDINGKEVDELAAGETVTIVADFIDENGIRWAKLSTGGWINMSESDAGDDSTVKVLDEPAIVTVVNSYVNIRSGAGTQYTLLGTANKGDQMTITKTKEVKGELWGRYIGGWISLTYTDFDIVMEERAEDADVVTAIGIVNVDKLNIRGGTGTKYPIVGALYRGDKVEITLQKTVGVMVWGKISNGWIWLDCVDLTPVGSDYVPGTDTSDKNETTQQPTTPAEKVIATGTVVNCTSLRIRAGAGTGNAQVGSLACGTSVEIYEKTTVGSQVWGRISKGWICLTTYVDLDASGSQGSTGSGTTSGGSTTASGIRGTVVNCSSLNIRASAGTNHAKVGKYANGTRVEILETTKVGSATWGRTSRGWVHLYYIRLDTTSGSASSGATASGSTSAGTSTGTMSGVVADTDELRIRSAAGVQNPQVGTLKRGTRVEILETTKVGSTTWGRISKGWISLYYVEMDSEVAGSTKTVTAASLNIRSGAGTSNAKVGSYPRGTQVKILETAKVGSTLWGRTNKGWISLDYVR